MSKLKKNKHKTIYLIGLKPQYKSMAIATVGDNEVPSSIFLEVFATGIKRIYMIQTIQFMA